MKFFVGLLVAALSQAVSCGHVSIQMPYSSPAGVTYVDASYHAGLAAGPVSAYSAPAAVPLTAAPVAAAAYAAIPTVQHVPGVADVPVTSYEAQPGVIQKVVDVAKPAVKTRKFEIRRPAIQKQFYDIEERVVVRPAGSAVVELDEPVSRTQKGPAVIHPAAVAAVPAFGLPVAAAPVAPVGVATVETSPIVSAPGVASTPSPVFEQEQQSFSDEDSVSIDNPDLARSSLSRSSGPSTPAPYPRYERPEPQPLPQLRSQTQPQVFPQPSLRASQSHESAQAASISAAHYGAPQVVARTGSAPQAYSAPAPALQAYSAPAPALQAYSAPAPALQAYSAPAPAPQTYSAPAPSPVPQSYSTSQTFGPAPITVAYPSAHSVLAQARLASPAIASSRSYQGPEVSQANQQRLIELLTARGGVTEVGLARSAAGYSASAGESGQIRGRVVSATPAPAYSEPAGERVNTRRVVVSRPIETLQEVEVAEPVTKFERIQVNQPTLIKTARQDVLRVPTSVPVYGKALAPVAHAAVPLALPAHQPWQ